jgi:hypothetical protein
MIKIKINGDVNKKSGWSNMIQGTCWTTETKIDEIDYNAGVIIFYKLNDNGEIEDIYNDINHEKMDGLTKRNFKNFIKSGKISII